MFHVEISNHKIIKNAFESISHIVDEITITADSEAMHLKCLSRDHTQFILLDLEKTVFDTFQCDAPEKISVDSTELMKVLKTLKPSDILVFNVDDNNLIITMKGDAERKFNIRLISLEYEEAQPPIIDLPSNISIGSDEVKGYIDDMSIYSEKLTMLVDGDYLRIRADGQMGSAEIKYIHGESITTAVQSSYGIDKLKDIFRASKFSQNCTLKIGEDMPLIVEFTLPTGDGCLEFLLAPRLEESD